MATLDFPRGDGTHHGFNIPAANWSSGGKLFFAAKPVIDDDSTDANAVINVEWNDTTGNITDVVIGGVNYKRYDCYFPPSATNDIVSNGAESADYLGEFQYVPNGGDPITIPALDPKIDVLIIFDVKRSTTTP